MRHIASLRRDRERLSPSKSLSALSSSYHTSRVGRARPTSAALLSVYPSVSWTSRRRPRSTSCRADWRLCGACSRRRAPMPCKTATARSSEAATTEAEGSGGDLPGRPPGRRRVARLLASLGLPWAVCLTCDQTVAHGRRSGAVARVRGAGRWQRTAAAPSHRSCFRHGTGMSVVIPMRSSWTERGEPDHHRAPSESTRR